MFHILYVPLVFAAGLYVGLRYRKQEEALALEVEDKAKAIGKEAEDFLKSAVAKVEKKL